MTSGEPVDDRAGGPASDALFELPAPPHDDVAHADEGYGAVWSAWLAALLADGRVTRGDVVAASGRRPNGRPWLDHATLSRWLRGTRPTYEHAVAFADAAGVPRAEALTAAGYTVDGLSRNAATDAATSGGWVRVVDAAERRAVEAFLAVYRGGPR